MIPPLVIVGNLNANNSITYSGPWFSANGTQNNTGDFGPPYQNSLKGVNVNADIFFAFNGTQVGVFVTYIAFGLQGPTWECLVDGSNTGVTQIPPPFTSQNNRAICWASVNDGNHKLTVNARVPKGQTFWFNYIQYAPSAGVLLNQSESIVSIDSSDSTITYSEGSWGWDNNSTSIASQSDLYESTHSTEENGAWLTLNFNGTSMDVIGNKTNASAYYFVDNENATFFFETDPAFINTIGSLFQVTNLDPGPHKLNIQYIGHGERPLRVTKFNVHNGTNASSPMSGRSSSTTSIYRRPIIGDFIGGIVFLSLFLNIWQSLLL